MISKSLSSTRSGIFILALTVAISFCLPAAAQNGMMPPLSTNATGDVPGDTKEYALSENDATHPILRLTPDKSDIVRLNEDATSLIIGNPAHLNILMDNPRTLIMVPRLPGATHFTVLNSMGKVVMQRHVIIASPKEDYIRVRRSCINGGGGCQETRVYYCPDMCHEVRVGAGQGNSSQSANLSVAPMDDDEASGPVSGEETAATADEDDEPLTNEAEEDIQYEDDDSDSSAE